MLNLGLLNSALARIEAEPHRWNQNGWVANEDKWGANANELYQRPPLEACGTTMCLAGHTLIETGSYVLAWKKYEDRADDGYGHDKYIWFFNVLEGEWSPSADGDAAKALGLDPEDDTDAALISRLFLTTGYHSDLDSFAEYKAKVMNAVNDYLVEKIADLERQVEFAKRANGLDDAVESLRPDPWTTASNAGPGFNDEPPF